MKRLCDSISVSVIVQSSMTVGSGCASQAQRVHISAQYAVLYMNAGAGSTLPVSVSMLRFAELYSIPV